jgi:hypothetical protein
MRPMAPVNHLEVELHDARFEGGADLAVLVVPFTMLEGWMHRKKSAGAATIGELGASSVFAHDYNLQSHALRFAKRAMKCSLQNNGPRLPVWRRGPCRKR